jgi:hypothetical protein
MRQLIISILFASLTSLTFSQESLQFNQVLTFTAQVPKGAGGTGPTYTVPEGKAWKVEAISSDGPAKMAINGTGVSFYFNSSNSSRGVFPFWLKAGDTIFLYDFGGGSGSYGSFLSILEFNTTQ